MFQSLPGFRDFLPEDCAIRNHLFRVWRQSARLFHFAEYDAPVLEPLDIFTQKSGEEIVGQLFNFVDKGGRAVTLRPEMTPLVARLVGEKAGSLKRPIRWFSVGEQYRYEAPQKGRLRAFYQWNCDIFGQSEPAADAELIALCAQALKAHGLTAADFAIRLSDRDLWLAWLAGLGFEGDRAATVLTVVDKMERDKPEEQIRKLQPLFGEGSEAFLKQVEKLKSLRTLADLSTFLTAETPEGPMRERVVKRLADWADLLSQLEALGVADCIRIDLGVVRGLAYYTGFVFEAFEATGKGRALAGGGRYDNLVEKLGYQPMPATGFAMGDVTLRILLEEKGLLPKMIQSPDFYCVFGGEAERKAALGQATTLRGAGYSVEVPIKAGGFGKQLGAAAASGAKLALIYGSDELARGVVKIRDLGAKKEAEFPQARIAEAVEQVLSEGIS